MAQACAAATLAHGPAFHPINATQVGLVWLVARKASFLKNGGIEEEFVDMKPWDKPQGQGPLAVPGPNSKATGVKEHVLKMASLLDQ